MKTFCPVCGYDLALTNPDALVNPCPCCAFDFEDANEKRPYSYFIGERSAGRMFVTMRRATWRGEHLRWCSHTVQKPAGWDPIQQLKNIGQDWANSYDEWMDRYPVIIPENKDKFLKNSRDQLRALTWKPEFIEAIWDGDTQGWMLDIWVSARKADGKYNTKRLWSLRGAGGDLRAFNGTVPPYPEGLIGHYLLDELSKEYGIPSYFPSDHPDDSYARFWERNENERCRTCNKHISQGLQGQCMTCHDREREAKKST